MIRWVYERALAIPGVDRVLAATDDERIARAVEDFGGTAVMTSPGCPSGSDRVFEAVRDMPCDVVLNLQGDEPTLDPGGVGALVLLMLSSPDLQMGTLVAPLTSPEDYENPNVVKVALGDGGRCLYFSRSPVPHLRDRRFEAAPLWRHIGIYAYRKEFLEAFTGWPTGALEGAESLEQLRALERGVSIRAAKVDWPGCAVDTPEDLARAEAYLEEEGRRATGQV